MTSSTHPDTARRGFLRRSIAIVPAAALTMSGGHTQEAGGGRAAVAPGMLPRPAAYSPAYFQPAEWMFVQAAVARLIPADENGPGALESGVADFIDRQMDTAFGHAATWYMQGPFVESAPEFGYQGRLPPREVYRTGIAASDAYCVLQRGGRVFAQLQANEQDEVLQGIESGAIAFDSVNARVFFGFLLQNTREGYLSDPMHGGNRDAGAWKMIGFPGARADYADGVGRPGESYPLPPVSILGPQG